MIYLFSDEPYEGVEHLAMIEICYMQISTDLSAFDAIVFTSKNSVRALEKSKLNWKNKESYAIGEGTKNAIASCGGLVAFTSKNPYGDLFAKELILLLKDKKVYFPRAKKVVSPVFEILRDGGIDVTQEIVYETKCCNYKNQDAPEIGSKLIFTSPSTVECFFQNFKWHESYIAIAIGVKTASAFPEEITPFICEKQTIEDCVSLAKAL